MITLLDNKQYDLEELIIKAKDDEFYYNTLGKLTLSSSMIGDLLTSPAKYYKSTQQESDSDSAALLIGGAIHCAILEPHKLPDLYESIDVSSRNTKAYKLAKEQSNKKILLQSEWQLMNDIFLKLTGNERFEEIMTGAEVEKPVIGLINNIPFRAKADIINNIDGVIYDLKTTSSLADFRYSAKKYNYDSQAFIYSTLFGKESAEQFKFVVVDKNTLEWGIFHITDEFLERGREKVMRAIENYFIHFTNKSKEQIESDLDKYFIEETLF